MDADSDFKYCTECKDVRPVSEFAPYARSRDGLRRQCVIHPAKKNGKNSNGKSLIDIPRVPVYPNQRHVYANLLKKQGGICAICQKAETVRADNGEILPLSFYFAIRKNSVRGLLCKLCGTGLSMFRDSPILLARAIEFISNNGNMMMKEMRVIAE